jgi:C4-dicarboxylate-specific signal transduction histidine kinase
LTLLDPMLRAARETRQTFSIAQFVREFVDLRKERLERFGIASPIEVIRDANITFNRGRLLQVFDNLFRNSEYWLRQFSSEHPKAELAVTLQIDGTLVLVSDTGPGIKPALERTLFELFVTDKPRGEGNGLGLFIVRQLLESEGCSIRLGAERNRSGRRYQFILDFTGAKSE